MWMLVARDRKPDAHVWSGRRAFALLDAVAWPAGIAYVASLIPNAGLTGLVVAAVAVLFALRRGWRALFRNERYWFTTTRVAAPLLVLVGVGALIKAFA